MKNPLALLVAAGIAWPAWSAPSARVELRAQAVVNAATVTLGQVAYIRSTDLTLARSLVNLRIGPAPRLGASAKVSRQALERWIQRQSQIETATLEWTGEVESATVTRASQPLAGERIADAALAALRDRLAAEGRSAQIELRSPAASIAVEPGELRLQVRDIAAARIRPHMVVWVEVWVDDHVTRAVPLSVSLTGVDRPREPASDALSSGDEQRDAPGMHRSVRRALAVQRGESAALRETSGAIALESRVEVLQDGSIGDKVRVRALHSTGLVLARVIGAGLLEIAP